MLPGAQVLVRRNMIENIQWILVIAVVLNYVRKTYVLLRPARVDKDLMQVIRHQQETCFQDFSEEAILNEYLRQDFLIAFWKVVLVFVLVLALMPLRNT